MSGDDKGCIWAVVVLVIIGTIISLIQGDALEFLATIGIVAAIALLVCAGIIVYNHLNSEEKKTVKQIGDIMALVPATGCGIILAVLFAAGIIVVIAGAVTGIISLF